MAYEVVILGHLHMPLYFLWTFTEYPKVKTLRFVFLLLHFQRIDASLHSLLMTHTFLSQF